MGPYPGTHVGTSSQLGYLNRVALTLPSKGSAEAAQGAHDIGQRQGQDLLPALSKEVSRAPEDTYLRTWHASNWSGVTPTSR